MLDFNALLTLTLCLPALGASRRLSSHFGGDEDLKLLDTGRGGFGTTIFDASLAPTLYLLALEANRRLSSHFGGDEDLKLLDTGRGSFGITIFDALLTLNALLVPSLYCLSLGRKIVAVKLLIKAMKI